MHNLLSEFIFMFNPLLSKYHMSFLQSNWLYMSYKLSFYMLINGELL